ncbi:hypothetical protein D3C76_1535620 [compost metagenome]
MPNGFLQADRLQEVNMRAHQPRRVRASKLAVINLRPSSRIQPRTRCMADLYFAVCQACQYRQPGIKCRQLLVDNHQRIRCQRLGIDSADENSAR